MMRKAAEDAEARRPRRLSALRKEAAPAVVSRTGSWLGDRLGRYFSLLIGSPAYRRPALKAAKRIRKDLDAATSAYKALAEADPARANLTGRIANLNSDLKKTLEPIAGETRKVRATRLGTGLLGLGGYGMYINNRLADAE